MIEEIRTKDFTLIGNVAKKCHLNPNELLLALQLKILYILHQKKEMKEDKLFSDTPVLNQFSEDTIKSVIEALLKKEANLWAKGHSLFFEELSLFLNYAHILSPMPLLQGKKDIDTAHKILGTTPEMDIEEIKKIYKKTALAKHPDKIGSQKLPKILEKKAISQFGKIQESYEIILASKKQN
jgi:DnaJ-domain-containing protein 1